MPDYTIVGVAKAAIFSGSKLIANGILDTLSNSSIEISTSSTEIRGGDRNKLIGVYYHTPTGNVNIENVKMNMELMASNFGAKNPGFGTEIFQSEVITLVGNKGTLSNTPVKIDSEDDKIYCYVGREGNMTKVEVDSSTKSFTSPSGISLNSEVEVLYRYKNNNVKYIRIPSSIIPDRVRIVLTVALSTNKTSQGIVGYCQIDLGVVQLSGTQSFDMTPDGYTTQSLTGMLLETNNEGFIGFASEASTGEYGKVTLIIKDGKWYDEVIGLAIEDGDFDLVSRETKKLNVYAITRNQDSFLADNSELTFTSGTAGTATIANGVVTAVAKGTSEIKVVIKEKTDIEAYCTVNVTA